MVALKDIKPTELFIHKDRYADYESIRFRTKNGYTFLSDGQYMEETWLNANECEWILVTDQYTLVKTS